MPTPPAPRIVGGDAAAAVSWGTRAPRASCRCCASALGRYESLSVCACCRFYRFFAERVPATRLRTATPAGCGERSSPTAPMVCSALCRRRRAVSATAAVCSGWHAVYAAVWAAVGRPWGGRRYSRRSSVPSIAPDSAVLHGAGKWATAHGHSIAAAADAATPGQPRWRCCQSGLTRRSSGRFSGGADAALPPRPVWVPVGARMGMRVAASSWRCG